MSVTVTTTGAITVVVSTPSASSVEILAKGPKGDTGLTGDAGGQGATGATGPAGANGTNGTNGTNGVDGVDGVAYASGGAVNQPLVKSSSTDYDTKWLPYALPSTDGPVNHYMQTDGAGVLSFARVIPGGSFYYSDYLTNTSFSGSVLASVIPSPSSVSNLLVGATVSLGDSSESTYGVNNTILLRNLSTGDVVSYTVTMKITTSATTIVSTYAPSGTATWGTGFSIIFASGSEQTVVISGSSTVTNNATDWKMYVSLAGSGSGNYRMSDLLVKVT